VSAVADLILGTAITLRIEQEDGPDDRTVTVGYFSCACGWSTTSRALNLDIPPSVRVHRAACHYSHPGQLTLGDVA